MSNALAYIGDELQIFEKAENWKGYYRKKLLSHLGNRVLEVGAGIGGTTLHLCDGSQKDWLCLEPDNRLSENILQLISGGKLPSYCRVVTGTLDDISAADLYDSVIYIDVIEHIEDDSGELKKAVRYLVRGGNLIVLVPAHQMLFSNFDRSIGHYRRYSRKQLEGIIPGNMKVVKSMYLDSFGFSVSVANKLFLGQKYPTLKQVLFWDRVIVPVSKFVDPLLGYNFGKSCLLIATKL